MAAGDPTSPAQGRGGVPLDTLRHIGGYASDSVRDQAHLVSRQFNDAFSDPLWTSRLYRLVGVAPLPLMCHIPDAQGMYGHVLQAEAYAAWVSRFVTFSYETASIKKTQGVVSPRQPRFF